MSKSEIPLQAAPNAQAQGSKRETDLRGLTGAETDSVKQFRTLISKLNSNSDGARYIVSTIPACNSE